jgi:replicative DNA helicase
MKEVKREYSRLRAIAERAEARLIRISQDEDITKEELHRKIERLKKEYQKLDKKYAVVRANAIAQKLDRTEL